MRQHRGMQNKTPRTKTAATVGRSSIKRLPPELREAVDAAIADGATIDEITALIRGEGGACSRSAVGRYTKNVRDLIRRQQETDRGIEMWVRALGDRPEGRAGLILVETLRDDDALHPRRTQQARGARDARRALPSLARSQAHRRHRQAPYRAGSARRRRPRRRPRTARARRRSGRASRPRPWPPSARSSRGGLARPSAPSHRRRSTPGILRNPT